MTTPLFIMLPFCVDCIIKAPLLYAHDGHPFRSTSSFVVLIIFLVLLFSVHINSETSFTIKELTLIKNHLISAFSLLRLAF